MNEWQNRVIEERNALQEKIMKLNDFIKCPKFMSLKFTDREILVLQLKIMQEYFQILELRIEAFNRV